MNNLNYLMACYMVAIGCNETSSGSYSFDYDELASFFCVTKEYIEINIESIIIELYKFDAVADAQQNEDDIDITFYRVYCNLLDWGEIYD